MFIVAIILTVTEARDNGSEAAFEVREINSQAGLYFEEIGKMRLFHEDWRLVTYLNLTVYQEEYDHIKSMVDHMARACNELISDPIKAENIDVSCGPVFQQIKSMVAQMDEYNVKWFIGSDRQKRALQNIVGSVSKALFGTLDETDARVYFDEFVRIKSENKIRDRIQKEHTSLIQSLTNLLQESEENTQNQIKILTDKITEIHLALEMIRVNFVQTWILKVKTKIQDMTSFVILLIMEYQNKQKLFLEAISVGQKSPNSPTLIPPQMFLEELDKIRREVNTRDLDFPLVPRTDTLATFYLISTPEARIINNQLIISFTLPLVTTVDYLLYKVTSLPNRIQENLFGYVVPTHEFVALDSFKEKYMAIDADELDNCHHLGNRRLHG